MEAAQSSSSGNKSIRTGGVLLFNQLTDCVDDFICLGGLSVSICDQIPDEVHLDVLG